MNIPDFPQLSNADRKFIRSLHTRKGRDEAGCFLAEGRKLCQELLESTFRTAAIILDNAADRNEQLIASEFERCGVPVFALGGREFEAICDAKTPQGIVGVAEYPKSKSEAVSETLIILDGVADPGNMGTIIRAADWFGFRSILLGKNCADRFSPKVVRAAMGSIFRCNIIDTPDIATAITQDFPRFSFFCATLDGSVALEQCRPKKQFGVIFGNESHGISPEILAVASQTFFIPGDGAESLNVSVAAGIALYHFSRCR
ncbi:RNA methyltransferase [Ignavibacteria bacterium]|nr:RNA methyltransferase [Bacteroidota bacterium]MCZ2133109.1 RNA methyltransferase [Bacteroidota bacterium]